MDSFNGYSLFNTVENPSLRAYNRCVVAMNMIKIGASEQAKEYVDLFNDDEKMMMMVTYLDMETRGAEEVGKEIRKNAAFDDEFYEQVVNG